MKVREYATIAFLILLFVLLMWYLNSASGLIKLNQRGVQFSKVITGEIWAAELDDDQATLDTIKLLVANVPSLEKVTLAGSNITDEGVQILAELPLLKSLDLSETEITDTALLSLKKAQKLKSLYVRGCKNLTEEGLASLKDCGQLVSFYTNHVPESYEELVELESRIPNLKLRIEPADLFELTPNGRVTAKWTSQGFRTLEVTLKAGSINGETIPLNKNEFEKFPATSIQTLRINSDLPLSQDVHQSLRMMVNIDQFQFHGDITPDVMSTIASLPKLEMLLLSQSNQQQSAAVTLTAADFQKLTQLERLSNIYCDLSLTDTSVFSGLMGMPQLIQLRIHSTNIRDEDLAGLQPLTNLRTLDVYGNQLTDDCYETVKNMQSLTSLDIRGNQLSPAVEKELINLVKSRKQKVVTEAPDNR